METAVTMEDQADVAMVNRMDVQDQTAPPDKEVKISSRQPRRRALGRRSQRGKRRGPVEKRRGPTEKRRGQKQKRWGQEEEKEGVTVKRTWSGGKRRWDKKQYCVFCRRPQVKIARHLLRKHADELEVVAASALPTGSKQRHLLLEHLRCRGNYLHNIEVIRQGSGEIVPWRQPSEDVDARNYLPCPLCLGFFLRADLWKHQVSCRKKLSIDPFRDPSTETSRDPSIDPSTETSSDPATGMSEDTSPEPSDVPTTEQTSGSDGGSKRPGTSDSGEDQNPSSEPAASRPRKRTRVQAAASRLLPISSGASESCSEILHRMNQDNVSHQAKSDWLICKYGNKLMGNQDGLQRRYDYVSQKLRELGRLLLAAKSLDSEVQNLQDLLAPGRLSLALAASRKAAGYRWSRPPLAVKTTLKTVCEIAIGENLLDGDWEAAARTTDFYYMLDREWDNLGLQNPGPDPAAPEGGTKLKKRLVQTTTQKDLRPEGLSKPRQGTFLVPPKSRLQTPVTGPVAPRKVQRRPWSSAEKEAIWRQLAVNVLVQTVPGKEVCQRCLDLEPVLRGRHWKDIKNQVHNQIQSQKKQQFNAQMDLEENQEHQDQIQNQNQNQKKRKALMDLQDKDHIQNQKKPQYQPQMDLHDQDNPQNHKRPQYQPQMDPHDQDNPQNQKRPQYQLQMNHQAQDSIQNQKKLDDPAHLDHQDHLHIHKKQLCHSRLDHQDHGPVHKKQLYQMDQQTLQTLDRDPSILMVAPYGPDGHRGPGHPLLDREPSISPYPPLHRAPGPHMDQLLSRTDWVEEALAQNYPLSRPLGRNLLQDVPPGGPPPDPHSGHVHF
ncbi:uncharacterized protein LOC127532550 [Acanthochromis polyacanthus]|uniref:uncharacterized protein LOC127532550 n=1 Tax=Acanthochromis polyacanthus TaxID=80966 RepID=UPI0022343043|nr:uncharacterized protein LOC127532550 [Acanthochromis polyacanthus]XP_051800336.1 uncharacterized protein LOC127532550 [Acanthochromis polyacanthus]XP_051800337.1 uncharacterized protein LOC127532550 [Acanthochromis polyacanthus]XP_051800338.1 uncharacterized protein LOC127532550 [Acanthochromis polyacanthus]